MENLITVTFPGGKKVNAEAARKDYPHGSARAQRG